MPIARSAANAETAKQLADALGVPAAFLYTEDDVLAKFLLRWSELSDTQRKTLLKAAEAAPARRRSGPTSRKTR